MFKIINVLGEKKETEAAKKRDRSSKKKRPKQPKKDTVAAQHVRRHGLCREPVPCKLQDRVDGRGVERQVDFLEVVRERTRTSVCASVWACAHMHVALLRSRALDF